MANNNIENVNIGPAKIFWNGVDLGFTKGGVEVSVETGTHDVTVDQFGESPIDQIIMSRRVNVKVALAETSIENLVRTMPGAKLVHTSGAYAEGWIQFPTSQPTDGNTIIINGVTFTFKDLAAGIYGYAVKREVAIGATTQQTAENLSVILRRCLLPEISNLWFWIPSNPPVARRIMIRAKEYGTAYNAVTLATGTYSGVTFSGATLTGGTAATELRADIPNAVGTQLYQYARKLVIRPQTAHELGIVTEDIIVPKAIASGGLSFAYTHDQERVYNLTFTGFPVAGDFAATLFSFGHDDAKDSIDPNIDPGA